jgi:hypothetical protein
MSILKPGYLMVDDFGNHCGNVFTLEGRFHQMIMKGGDVRAAPVKK